MDFAKILDEWDRRTPQKQNFRKDEEVHEPNKNDERRRLHAKKPDAFIDLHGLTREEAWDSLDEFFKRSLSLGHEKIMIIHGKGNHSKNEGVLKEVSRSYIEHCSFAGASGHSTASRGGSGATWVLLKTGKT